MKNAEIFRRATSAPHNFARDRFTRENRALSLSLAILVLLVSYYAKALSNDTEEGSQAAGGFELKTSAFNPGGDIPKKFTCDGADASPELTWNDPPVGTRSFTLIADDPDAPVGTWVHWVLYDLPSNTRRLPEGVPRVAQVQGGRHGQNDFPALGYGGPCPPPGKPHRYFFKLYALDTELKLDPRKTKQEVEQAMKGHVLAQATLMGRYHR